MRRASALLFETSLGACALAWGARGARRLLLPDEGDPRLLLQRAVAGTHLQWHDAPEALRRAAGQITKHLGGERRTLNSVAVDLEHVPPFHRDVFHALRTVPAGQTISYGALATLAGRPGAARAVGSAMARNPLPLLVPCHRVLPASGALGDFSAPGGAQTKLKLLLLEGADLGPAGRASSRVLAKRDTELTRSTGL